MSDEFKFLAEIENKILDLILHLRVIVENMETIIDDIVHYETGKK